MTKHEVIRYLTDYFAAHNIQCVSAIADGMMTLNMAFPAPDAPSEYVESCIFFYENDMETRIYYSADSSAWCRESRRFWGELYRLLNFINARVFLHCADGCGGALYCPRILYTPRFYLTEDDSCDLSMTTVIPYDFFELAPLETADYLTGFSAELLNALAKPIFLLLLGKINVEEAITLIRQDVLNETDNEEGRG